MDAILNNIIIETVKCKEKRGGHIEITMGSFVYVCGYVGTGERERERERTGV